ncbi:hypothetical protein [Actinomarinicola tropica]|nr:hypothetical protein [Actinomarinicola tropica]
MKRDNEKEVMTKAAERILRWSFLTPLLIFAVVIVVLIVASL